MTDIFKEPQKKTMKRDLLQLGITSLQKSGWRVERIAGSGKSSVRRIIKGKESRTISIRTSQDTWIAFPRNEANNAWATLAEVDYVIAVSVDVKENPQFVKVHMIPGAEMRERFDRAYEARKRAGHVLPKGRGMWVSLYYKESKDPVNRVGAGAGLEEKYTLACVPIKAGKVQPDASRDLATQDALTAIPSDGQESMHLTIPEVKRLLALSLGVNESDIRITVST